MRVALELPTAVEASWELLDKEGAVVAKSGEFPGATLHIHPFFYRGSYSQTLARILVAGKRGRKSDVSLKVGGSTGQVTAASVAKALKPVEPAFDKPLPAKAVASKPAATTDQSAAILRKHAAPKPAEGKK